MRRTLKSIHSVLNALLGSAPLFPTSHWVSVLGQPTDNSNLTLARIHELPFLSVHSIFLVIINGDIILPVIQAVIFNSYFSSTTTQSLKSYLLYLLNLLLSTLCHCFNWSLPGGHCRFPNWSLVHFPCHHQTYFLKIMSPACWQNPLVITHCL